MSDQPSPDYVGMREAEQITGLSDAGIRRRVRIGQLTPAMKLPGKTGPLLFHRADIEAVTRLAVGRPRKTAPAPEPDPGLPPAA